MEASMKTKTSPRITKLVMSLNNAATMLRLHGLISDAERAKVHRKLISLRMALEVREASKTTKKEKK